MDMSLFFSSSCHHPISPSLSSSQGSNRISRNLSARGYYTSNEMCWERLDFVIPAPSTRTFSVTGFRGPSPRLLPTMMEDIGRDGLLFGRESRNLVRRHLFYVRMMRWCAQISSFLIITRSTDLFFTFHLIKTRRLSRPSLISFCETKFLNVRDVNVCPFFYCRPTWRNVGGSSFSMFYTSQVYRSLQSNMLQSSKVAMQKQNDGKMNIISWVNR